VALGELTAMNATEGSAQLRRELGLSDAVLTGLGAMLGAGIFVTLAPTAGAAGAGLLIALAIAAVVAYCNADSSARLAARYPSAGGTYVYGRERLGMFWGYLAGWGFLIGKTASCAAMALTAGSYLWPDHAHAVAVVATLALTAVNYLGIQKSAWVIRVLVAVVLLVLLSVVIAAATSSDVAAARLDPTADLSATGLLEAAGLWFFAFAGYARIATLGEEVRDPVRTISRAITIALATVVVIYASVAVAALAVMGSGRLSNSSAPLVDVVRAAGMPALVPVVTVGATVAALGALLTLILGVSRTTLAMARDGHFPRGLAAIHPRYGVPHRAEVVVGVIVAVVAATFDVRDAIGFSAFAVLVYYAVANVSALTLSLPAAWWRRPVPVVGLMGCLLLAFSLPTSSVIVGLGVFAAGLVVYGLRVLRRRSTADH
jgi:APA family basic amino acid/polyamine antiporter